MANDYDPKKNGDNWDDQPKYDGGAEKNYYRQYTPPTDNGIFPDRPAQPPRDAEGSTSKVLGFVGLFLTICGCCNIAGIVLGIIGYVKARASFRTLGFETSDAATGRVLGIVDIVLGSLSVLVSIAYAVFLIVSGSFAAMMAGEAGTAFPFQA